MSDSSVIVWDLETVPDLAAAGRMLGLAGQPPETIREKLGDGFPKLPLHSIACIGALIASRTPEGWIVRSLGAPHIGERSEADLITAFVDKIEDLSPRLVTFNGSGFDLPVLRYRAMLHAIPAPGLRKRNYFNRYSDDAVDLCDVLSSYGASTKVKLDDLAKGFGLPGKPEGMEGSQVEAYVHAGRIREVAEYCESDVINTYRVWLRYEVFRGALSLVEFELSERNLEEFVQRKAAKGAAGA
jgi:predicted PolB exonuclease-like 3'-5' exonuclease